MGLSKLGLDILSSFRRQLEYSNTVSAEEALIRLSEDLSSSIASFVKQSSSESLKVIKPLEFVSDGRLSIPPASFIAGGYMTASDYALLHSLVSYSDESVLAYLLSIANQPGGVVILDDDGFIDPSLIPSVAINLATNTIKGISKLSLAAVDPLEPIAVGDNDPRLLSDIITPGTVGDSTHYPIITYDAKGRITAVSDQVISPVSSATNTILRAVVSGTQDGSNTTFNVPTFYNPATLLLIRNNSFDYNIVEGSYPTTQFTISDPPLAGELLYAIYIGATGANAVELNGLVAGTQDGVNTSFTTPIGYVAGTLMLIRNGVFDFDITEGASPSFTINNPPVSGELLRVLFQKI